MLGVKEKWLNTKPQIVTKLSKLWEVKEVTHMFPFLQQVYGVGFPEEMQQRWQQLEPVRVTHYLRLWRSWPWWPLPGIATTWEVRPGDHKCETRLSYTVSVNPAEATWQNLVLRGRSKKRAWYPAQWSNTRVADTKVLNPVPSTARGGGWLPRGPVSEVEVWAIRWKIRKPFQTAGEVRVSEENSKEEEILESGPEEWQRVDKGRISFRKKAQRTGVSGHICRPAGSSVRLEATGPHAALISDQSEADTDNPTF